MNEVHRFEYQEISDYSDKRFGLKNGLLYRVIHNLNRGMASCMSASAFERELIKLLNEGLKVINEVLGRALFLLNKNCEFLFK